MGYVLMTSMECRLNYKGMAKHLRTASINAESFRNSAHHTTIRYR